MPLPRRTSRVRRDDSFAEIELYPMTSRLPTFDTSEVRGDKFGGPRFAERGNSIKQGHHIAFSIAWLTSVDGLEAIQLYLWILKDWSWCQLHWVYLGLISGTAAVMLSIILLLLALSTGLYSEAYVATAMLFWLSANYVWMLGEFVNENWLDDPQEVFYEKCVDLTKIFGTTAVMLLFLYFALLMPTGFFEQERRNNKVMARLLDDSPRPRFRFLFPTFRDYETTHLLFWAIKDTCWVYNFKYAYAIGFVPTLMLNVDLAYLYATHRNQFSEFIHCIVLGFWVLSNGVWAYGEMIAEITPEGLTDDEFISPEQWDAFDWPDLPLPNTAFRHRYAACWIFLVAVLVLIVFYVHWWIVSMRCPPIEQAEDYEPKSVATTENVETHRIPSSRFNTNSEDHHVVAI